MRSGEYYKRGANKEIYVEEKITKSGKKIEELRSSSDLSIEEMCKSITNFIEYILINCGFSIPPATDENFTFWVQQEYEKQQQYLNY
jgi:hypothetical protein